MRRLSKHKPKTRWLQDTRGFEFGNIFKPEGGSAQVTSGTTGTLQFPFLRTLSSQTFDPATLLADGTLIGSPRTQLLAQPGWRLMRCVGEFTVALAQVGDSDDPALYAQHVQCEAGLFLGEIDEQGALQNGADWHLPIPVQIPDDDASRAVQMEGEGRPWIWRRSWLLSNMAAQNTAQNAIPGDNVAGGNPFKFTHSDTDGYPLGPSGNWHMPYLLGPHFDIKRHATMGRNQALFWAFGAVGINAGAHGDNENKFFRVAAVVRHRTLIARQGRPWKDER